MNRTELASKIDHAALKPETTPAMIDQLCEEAVKYGFVTVFVNPQWVRRCADRLTGTAVGVGSVAGFPFGTANTEIKVAEARQAMVDGAVEIDMVLRIGDLIAGNTGLVSDDIAAVADAVHALSANHILKVILETAVLTEDQIIAGCRCAVQAGADFVKTSTGFHPAGGATVEAVALLKEHARPLKVKASGGIRDLAGALAMIQAGADRLGSSSSVKIINEIK
ncbi:MAG: deoxyribose-phosphate aldolase [Planctomycetota bacterium]|jgi:deoxyribose-phosphate aldolase